jgi:hypothetical protein
MLELGWRVIVGSLLCVCVCVCVCVRVVRVVRVRVNVTNRSMMPVGPREAPEPNQQSMSLSVL